MRGKRLLGICFWGGELGSAVEAIDGQRFQLLQASDAEEIEAAETEEERARFVCDFLAGMTDGFAARMCRRLFEPGYGSIGDLVG